MLYRFSMAMILSISLTNCSPKGEPINYEVNKLNTAPVINAVWDKPPWNNITALSINDYMGEKPIHFPSTQAKVAFDDEAIYIIFRVKDQYIKAVHHSNQDPVYKDSCVEFFFSPEETTQKGYFNLEMNCGGTMLFRHQKVPRKGGVNISDGHIAQIEVAHSLPKIIDPEINEKTTWVVEYRIPFSLLKYYHDFSNPDEGSIWRANFYKCADETSHPHWITWAPIDNPTPDFHLPDYFGKLIFR
jgi:hypothetical protein